MLSICTAVQKKCHFAFCIFCPFMYISFSEKKCIMKSNRAKSHVNYTPITSSGEVLLPGRHECNCEATKHALINNCLNCGRIVCEQERSGPCFTCGELVSIL